ncbi:hypothetical protein BDV93DRAFT_567204 [Ceratobasidium sp. AG-I]|nr:hypothetical protein BDV93DRAFT_567204 [Ceratobasidium sp. AG-I]
MGSLYCHDSLSLRRPENTQLWLSYVQWSPNLPEPDVVLDCACAIFWHQTTNPPHYLIIADAAWLEEEERPVQSTRGWKG